MKRKLTEVEKLDRCAYIIMVIYAILMPILLYVFLGTAFLFGFWM